MESCTVCGKPIEVGQPSYYRKNPKDDIGGSFHSACGDALGIELAFAAERERCANLAEDCAADRFKMPCGGLTDDWREGFEAACEFIAAVIRRR